MTFLIQPNESAQYSINGRNKSVSTSIGFSPFDLNLKEKTHGGTQYDIANSVAVTPDGGVVVVGTSDSGQEFSGACTPGACTPGYKDVYASKYDVNGNRSWTRLIGASKDDEGYGVSVRGDGSILIAGSTRFLKPDGYTTIDTYLVRLSPEGSILWQRTHGDQIALDRLFAVLPTEDGGLIAVGDSDSTTFPGNQPARDAYVVRLNSSGEIVWHKLLGGNGEDTANGICKLGDDYFIAGTTKSSDLPGTGSISNFYVAKLSSSGQILSQKRVGNVNYNEGSGIACISGGPHGDSVVIVGKSSSTNNEYLDNLYFVQLTPTLDTIWQKVFGGAGNDKATGVVRDPLNPNYVFISGETIGNSFLPFQGGSSDGFVVRVNLADGKVRWTSSLGGSVGDSLSSIAIRPDGYIYTAGKTQSSDIDGENQGSQDIYLAGFKPPVPFTDTTAPTLTGDLTVESYGCGKVSLEWPHAQMVLEEQNESGLNHYSVSVDSIKRGVTQGKAQRKGSDKRNFVLSDLEPGSTHNFRVAAVDRAGNESIALVKTFQLPASTSSICTDTVSPTTPNVNLGGFLGTGCNRSFRLEITGSTDSGSSGLMEYRIYKNEVGPLRISANANGSPSAMLDVSKFPGERDTYRVEAMDRAGNISPSRTIVYHNPSDCGYVATPKRSRLATLIVTPNEAPLTPPATRNEIAQMVTGVGGEFDSYGAVQYLDEVSYGTHVLDPVYISPDYIRLPEPILKNGSIGYCENMNALNDDFGDNCDSEKIFNHAIASSGLNQSDYDHFLILTDRMITSLANGKKSFATVVSNIEQVRHISFHELMHVLGESSTGHTGGNWNCPGMPVTLSVPISGSRGPLTKAGANPDDPLFGCANTLGQYLDFYSAAGYGDGYHIPVYLKMLKGFLRPEQTATVSYQNYPSQSTLTLDAVETRTAGLKQILIPIGRNNNGPALTGSVLSLEYRTLRGFNTHESYFWTPVQGVQIRLIPYPGSLPNLMETILMGTILTNAGTTQPFHYGDIRIEVLQGDTESARVKISRY
ncbi:hypothetical protein AB3N59_04020 [Leptospira sp. WS92.C1]